MLRTICSSRSFPYSIQFFAYVKRLKAVGAPEEVAEGLGEMGATYIPDLIPCARKIMYVVIDTLTRSRKEMGL